MLRVGGPGPETVGTARAPSAPSGSTGSVPGIEDIPQMESKGEDEVQLGKRVRYRMGRKRDSAFNPPSHMLFRIGGLLHPKKQLKRNRSSVYNQHA